jgi:hypothetical protein
MTLRNRSAVLLFLACITAGKGVLAQTATDANPPTRPLNLSLPRDVLWSSTIRYEVLPVPRGREVANLPDLGSRPGASAARGHLPYGSGYEARQVGSGTGNAGMASGSGHGRGGMGRGR